MATIVYPPRSSMRTEEIEVLKIFAKRKGTLSQTYMWINKPGKIMIAQDIKSLSNHTSGTIGSVK